MDVAAEKAAFRARFRAFRMNLSPEDHAARSAALVARVLALPELSAARTVHVYWPHARLREVDTRPLAAALHAAGKTVVLPRVASADPPALALHAVPPGAPLVAGPFGLFEPPPGPTVPPDALDLAVLPGLGADRHGVRLGYGRGFYDRLLGGRGVPTVLAVFAECLVSRLPAGPDDVPVKVVVTELETLRPSSRS